MFSARRYGIDALDAQAQGIFCSPLINMVCRRLGWVKDGDLKLQ